IVPGFRWRELAAGWGDTTVRALDLGLPTLARTGGTAQDDVLLFAAGDQEGCAGIRRFDEVLAWWRVLLDERLLDGLRALRLLGRGGRRVHVCEQMGGSGFACFTDVDHVPGPLRVALVAVARLAIVGRFDPFGSRWQCLGRLETHTALRASACRTGRVSRPFVVALPGPPQALQDRQR